MLAVPAVAAGERAADGRKTAPRAELEARRLELAVTCFGERFAAELTTDFPAVDPRTVDGSSFTSPQRAGASQPSPASCSTHWAAPSRP
ncbi:hypothetical protein GCM10010423_29650 [Streptomyces levis]|uniref:Uncharacterized protein n=1 Tax=Streptomyces levis TaxID=285566 RepID=A0ABP6B2C4_9ACTN